MGIWREHPSNVWVTGSIRMDWFGDKSEEEKQAGLVPGRPWGERECQMPCSSEQEMGDRLDDKGKRLNNCVSVCVFLREWVVVAGNYSPPTVSGYQSPEISVYTKILSRKQYAWQTPSFIHFQWRRIHKFCHSVKVTWHGLHQVWPSSHWGDSFQEIQVIITQIIHFA